MMARKLLNIEISQITVSLKNRQ